jgi:hypothetical protein
MMRKSAEADQAKSELYAKEQRKAQLETQRDERTDHFKRIKIQTHENEQKLKENEYKMTEQVRREREIGR